MPTDRYPWWNPTDKCVQIGNSKIKPHDVVLVILREALDRAVKWVRDTDFADIGESDIKGITGTIRMFSNGDPCDKKDLMGNRAEPWVSAIQNQ